MQKLLIVALVLCLAGCGKKEWSKSYITKKCEKEMDKNEDVKKLIKKEQVVKICDCAADKMLVKYKSEAAADKDEAGASAIGRDCALEVMQGAQPEE